MSQVTEEEIGVVLSTLSRVTDAAQFTRVRAVLNSCSETLGRQQVRMLRVGMRVSWTGKHGFTKGIVIKIKQKYVECRADAAPGAPLTVFGGTVWNVPGSMLTPIQAVKP